MTIHRMSAVPSDSLDPFYYLDNFQRVLDWLAARYNDLLIEDERRFIARFPQLPQVSRALLVRMAMRKGEFFRSGKLRYAEIGCPDAAAAPLLAEGWLQHDPPLDVGQIFGLLRKMEIVELFALPATARQTAKAELQAALMTQYADTRSLSGLHAGEWSEAIYQIAIAPLCERFRLMFFGNLHQTWSEFVLADLGIYRYEQVELAPSSRGFVQRRDVDDYLHLNRCRERFDQGDYLDDILPDIPAESFSNPWLEARRNKLLFVVAQQYERCGELRSALDLYRRCNHPGARLRTIRTLERSEAVGEAFALAQDAQENPESEAEQQALLRMLPRLRRRLELPAPPKARTQVVERIDLMLPFPSTPVSVEIAAAHHLTRDDAPVLYVENALINSLFGLLCWPAIFAAVPGAFFHPFHAGPADLHAQDFRHRRAELFDSCFSLLENDDYRQAILDTYRTKYGIVSYFVHWDTLDETLLQLALTCLPAAHLKKCFERLLRDIPANRSGFPDLIQFLPQEKSYRMIEVKGPGDRLQDNQIRWMDYFVTHGMPVAVCHVQWMVEP
jgi:hypothetical protein